MAAHPAGCPIFYGRSVEKSGRDRKHHRQRQRLHDTSDQYHDLAHFDYILNPTTRISLIVGISNEEFQIPDNPDQSTFTLANGQGAQC